MRRRAAVLAIGIVLAACVPEASTPTASPTSAIASAVPTPAQTVVPTLTATPSPRPAALGGAPEAIRFVDPKRGWIGTQDGILGTLDGGATWDRQLAGTEITKIWSYDANRAWALAADHALYRTGDGTHWTAVVPQPNPPIAALDVFSPDLLWAIGVAPSTGPASARLDGNVMRSEDGGATWRVVGLHTMWSVCFDTTTDGIGAEAKQIFRTSDAGRTWTLVATLAINDDGPYWYPTLTCPIGTHGRVQITEPNAAAGHAPYLVYRTNDGGRSWILEFREGYTLGTTTPPNTPQLGSFPSIMGSNLAGGRSWFMTCTPALDRQEFLFVGPTGETLARGPVPIPGCASDGQVLDGTNVIAVSGSTASVLATDDGGTTWRTIYKGRPRV